MGKYSTWLQKAKDDLKWTRHNIEGGFYLEAGFTAQQSIEKALKYYLLSQGKRLRKIHDLTILLQDCMIIDKEFEQFIEQSAKITFYYIESRYPEILPTGTVSKSEVESTYAYAKRIISFVSERALHD